jgi:hypothetical protein
MKDKTISVHDIQSGDLLAWSKNANGGISDKIIRGVASLTDSKYGHVGIAWRCHDGLDDEVMVVEATIPRIQIARVTNARHFFCVPMGVLWNNENKKFLMDKIGLSYGLMDAARSYLGIRVEADDKWQCAELSHGFYTASGIILPEEFKPSEVVRNAMKHSERDIYRVLV